VHKRGLSPLWQFWRLTYADRATQCLTPRQSSCCGTAEGPSASALEFSCQQSTRILRKRGQPPLWQILSGSYLGLFLAGVWIAWRQRSPLLVLLIPIAYVPLTIGMVLTNMRYTITVQPLMFAFIAFALRAALSGLPIRATGDLRQD
jgi:hypothetical protein